MAVLTFSHLLGGIPAPSPLLKNATLSAVMSSNRNAAKKHSSPSLPLTDRKKGRIIFSSFVTIFIIKMQVRPVILYKCPLLYDMIEARKARWLLKRSVHPNYTNILLQSSHEPLFKP